MFDLRNALASVDGAQCDFDALEDLLARIRRENLAEISPEVGTRELLRVALLRGWITEDDDGQFHVQLDKAA
jgi:hypothetical protein